MSDLTLNDCQCRESRNMYGRFGGCLLATSHNSVDERNPIMASISMRTRSEAPATHSQIISQVTSSIMLSNREYQVRYHCPISLLVFIHISSQLISTPYVLCIYIFNAPTSLPDNHARHTKQRAQQLEPDQHRSHHASPMFIRY